MSDGEAVSVYNVSEGPADAPVLVMSHSLGAALDTWRPQAEALAGPFRVLRYDLRGHGRSPVPPGPYAIADLGADIVGLLDRLDVPRAHLCGLSLGAMASMWVAAHHPERVARLVVCCTSARLGPPEFWAERARVVRARGVAAVVDTILSRWFTAGWLEHHKARAAELAFMIAATPAEGYAACCAAIQHMDLTGDLGAIRAPTLAIAGAQDPSTPPEHLQRIAAGIPRCQLMVIEEAAHLANIEQAAQVTELIRQHLEAGDEPEEEREHEP